MGRAKTLGRSRTRGKSLRKTNDCFLWVFYFQAQINSTGPVTTPLNLEFVKDLWLPNIFIYNLKTYKVIDVLSKLAGLWIDTDKKVLYSQATQISSFKQCYI